MKTKIPVIVKVTNDKNYLFTPDYVPIEIPFQEMPDSYVSDAITENEIRAFENLVETKGEDAEIIYKEQWLRCDASPDIPDISILHKNDLDRLESDANMQALLEFLDKEAEKNSELIEGTNDFKVFSQRFTELYKKAFPKNTSLNRGKKRKVLGHEAIQNHLKKITEFTDEEYEFFFDSGSEKNSWELKKMEATALSHP